MNKIFFVINFCTFIIISPILIYPNSNIGKLDLDSKSNDMGPEYAIYFNAGYFQEISSKGESIYLSAGVLYRSNPKLELRLGFFYDTISGIQLSTTNSSNHTFAGIEFGLNYYFLPQYIIKPFIGFQVSATIIEEIYNRNAINAGFQIQFGDFISLTPYYSLAHTLSPKLYGFTNHFGGIIFSLYF